MEVLIHNTAQQQSQEAIGKTEWRRTPMVPVPIMLL
jgi:hypothetical protein